MTSNLTIPTISKVNKVGESVLKGLIGRKMTKNVKFMGEDIKISKLTVSEVLEIQQKAKELETEASNGLEVLKTVIKAGVEEAQDLTDEDFASFPMDELSKLSAEIVKYSGMGAEQGK